MHTLCLIMRLGYFVKQTKSMNRCISPCSLNMAIHRRHIQAIRSVPTKMEQPILIIYRTTRIAKKQRFQEILAEAIKIYNRTHTAPMEPIKWKTKRSNLIYHVEEGSLSVRLELEYLWEQNSVFYCLILSSCNKGTMRQRHLIYVRYILSRAKTLEDCVVD